MRQSAFRIDKAEREAEIDKYDFQRLSSKPNSLNLNLSPQPYSYTVAV